MSEGRDAANDGTYIPIDAVECRNFLIATVTTEVCIQMLLPDVRGDALSRERVDVVVYVREEYVKTAELPLYLGCQRPSSVPLRDRLNLPR